MATTPKRRVPEPLWQALPLVFALAYALAFTRLYRALGPGAESFATAVVLLAAGQRGLVAGLGAAAGCVALHVLMGELVLGIAWSTWLQGGQLATAMGLALVGAVVGRLRDLRVQLDAEVAARVQTEIQLREAQHVAHENSENLPAPETRQAQRRERLALAGVALRNPAGQIGLHLHYRTHPVQAA